MDEIKTLDEYRAIGAENIQQQLDKMGNPKLRQINPKYNRRYQRHDIPSH